MCTNPYKQRNQGYQNDILPGYTGNIDLTKRPQVPDGKGNVMTVRTISIGEDGKEVLIPTISQDGKLMSDREAVDYYRKTGQHFGKFKSIEDANDFAQKLHLQQEEMYVKNKRK